MHAVYQVCDLQSDLELNPIAWYGQWWLFVNAVEKIVGAARKHGKWVARLTNSGGLCKEHLKMFDAVAMSYDIRAIQNWYTAELQVARS